MKLDYTRWSAVEGYCFPLSYEAGASVELRCSASAARPETVTIEVARVGAEREVVLTRSGLTAGQHPIEEDAWAAGCDWPVTTTIETSAAWPSGYYEVTIAAEDRTGPEAVSEAFFVLRAPAGRPSNPGLLILATNTYNAYNQWGGRGLYSGANTVSFARPIERGFLRRPSAPDEVDFDGRITNVASPSDPEHRRLVAYQAEGRYPLLTDSSGWHNWERRFVRWAERAGFSFDYAVNADIDAEVGAGHDVLAGHRLALSVGHDEYWSWGMRDSFDGWVTAGGNHAIFSGNTCFWQVRYEDGGRTMVCHKGRARIDDPVCDGPDLSRLTSMWSDPLIARPETSTIGLTFSRGGYHRVGDAVPLGSGAYTIARPEHWAFEGTGLRYGDQLGAGSFVVGYEVDGCTMRLEDGLPVPTGEDGGPEDLEILATAPARLMSITEDRCEAPAALWASLDPPGDLEGVAMILFGDASAANVAKVAAGHAVMGSFGKGAGTVFNAGSADWAYGLDTDPLVQRVTANVLTRLGAGGQEVG